MAKHQHQRTPRNIKGSRKEDHQQKNKAHGDSCHNRDRPCCTRLNDLANGILPQETADGASQSGNAGGLLRLLLQERTSLNGKKKRKKKKKKKSKDTSASTDAATEIPVEGPTAKTDDPSSANSTTAATESTDVVTDGQNVRPNTLKPMPTTVPRQQQPKLDPVAQQQHRQRRVQRLVHQLLDRTSELSSEQQQDENSNRWAEFLATAATSPRIPHTTIEEALEEVQCRHCRRDAQRYCTSAAATRSRSVSLHGCTIGTVHDVVCQQDVEDQHAQYQLFMEEGMVPRNWTLQLDSDNSDIDAGQQCWSIIRSGSGASDDMSSSLQDLVLFLLEHYVLLQGLHPDTVVGTENIAKYRDYEGLATTGRDNLSVLNREFEHMTERITSAIAKFATTTDHDKEEVHVHSFPILQDVDSIYDGVFDSLLRIAFETTRRVFRVQSGYRSRRRTTDPGTTGNNHVVDDEEWAADVHWVSRKCEHLWRYALLEPLHQQLHLLQQYEEQLAATADRLGGFRTMYADANSRTIFRHFVERKGILAYKAVKNMEACLFSDTHVGGWSDVNCGYSKTFFARRLYMEDGLWQVEGGALQGSSLSFVDQAFEDVLTTLRELTETLHKPKVAQLAEENHRRLAKFSHLVQKANQCLSDVRQGCNDCSGEMDRLASRLQITSTALSPLDSSECSVDENVLTSLRSAIVPSIQNVVDSWVHLHERFSSAGDETNAAPHVPFEHRVRLVVALTEECTGGNGSVRFHNLFVALFFEKLLRDFTEWQARIAEQELLTNFNSVEEPQRLPSSKKPKKKKGKKATATKSVTTSPTNHTAVPERTEEKEDEESLDDKPGIPRQDWAPATVASKEGVQNGRAGQDTAQLVKVPPECFSVGVTSSAGKTTMEEFLVGRLETLLASDEQVTYA